MQDTVMTKSASSSDFIAIVKNRLPKKNDLLKHYLLKNQKKNKSFLSLDPLFQLVL